MNKNCGIYKIVSKITGDLYIGQSVRLNQRWKQHLLSLQKHKHGNYKLQILYDTYGENNLSYSVLENCSKTSLNNREQYYIDTLNPSINIVLNVKERTGVQPKIYDNVILLAPGGKIFTKINNLAEFCRNHDLGYVSMFNLMNRIGYTKTYKGWTLLENLSNEYEEPDFVLCESDLDTKDFHEFMLKI